MLVFLYKFVYIDFEKFVCMYSFVCMIFVVKIHKYVSQIQHVCQSIADLVSPKLKYNLYKHAQLQGGTKCQNGKNRKFFLSIY